MVATRRSQRTAAAAATKQTNAAPPAAKKQPLKASNAKTPPAPVTQKKKPAATNKRKAASAAAKTKKAPTKAKKQKLTGLTKEVSVSKLGVVDPEAKIDGGRLCSVRDASGSVEMADVMLALVDPSKNSDKFYILQLIESVDTSDQKENATSSGPDAFDSAITYHVFTRWGRTGTPGQALKFEFPEGDWTGALDKFEDIFSSKTGHSWEDRDKPTAGNKYRFVYQNHIEKTGGYSSAKWQYYVDDGVDGKTTGWYDYDDSGSKQVERLFSEFTTTNNRGGMNYFATRSVESGQYTYTVDLVKMTQTNSTHPSHTSRRIRRCPNGVAMDDDNAPLAPSVASAASLKTSPVAVASAPPMKTKGKTGSHPVDASISVEGEDANEYAVVQGPDGIWYDSVLNQCNIGNNNNKYYRLQMLQNVDTLQFFVWMRWGRVGEAARKSASKFVGPYASIAAAKKEFCKKYKDKTKNTFGAANFGAYTGKYVPIEIDNDVEVTDDMKLDADATNVKVEYEPSSLDAKTKELIQALFSKDLQNEALVSFDLDLKRLPLGVPSQAQIQSGVDILVQIEDKMNGNRAIRQSYEELSSNFYTAIPHSFGRTRPPIIQDKESLQSRFDMCNILLDLYDTNQTMRRIETEQKQEAAAATTKKLTNPIDQHYASLKADLTPVHPLSAEFTTIRTYFDATKHQGSRAQLLDVWAVDRHNESSRFAKYNDTDNRQLLWHGTNIAVVAPILTSGLRIMPHSGGRVGSGIYLANLQQKSAQYTCAYGAKFACMFLCEAPLGKQHIVNQDGPHASQLKTAPAGFDSVRAVGQYQPKQFATMNIDGKQVTVPTSAPSNAGVQSTFSHDEMLCYDEAQVRIRYVVSVRM